MCVSAARAAVIDLPVSSRVARIVLPVVPPVMPELAPCRVLSSFKVWFPVAFERTSLFNKASLPESKKPRAMLSRVCRQTP